MRTGGANRDRTGDLLLAKQALSQLSYGPAVNRMVVGLDGFEPSTPALSRRCSNQLSYRPAWVDNEKIVAVIFSWLLFLEEQPIDGGYCGVLVLERR